MYTIGYTNAYYQYISMLLKILIYLIPILGILTITSFVLIRSRSSQLNKNFAYLNISIVVWLLTLLVADTAKNPQLALISLRSALAASIFMGYRFLIFSYNFPRIRKVPKIISIYSTVVLVVLMLLSFTHLIIPSISIEPSGAQIDEVTILYTIHSLLLISFFLIGIISLFQSQRRASVIEKQQIKLLLFAITSTFIINVFTGYILNLVNVKNDVNLVGASSFFIFTAITAYTIIKHKLFDIRLIVARSLGYLLTIATLVLVYVVAIFGLSSTVIGENKVSNLQQIIYIVATLIFGFSLLPLKRFFDRLTNKLFYRDAYDSQELLDELNKILVGNIDIQPLLHQCAELFETTLKAEHCTFIIKETEDSARRIIGSKKVDLDEKQILELSSQNHKIDQIIVADELDESQTTLKSMLSNNNVSILARLAPAGKNAVEQGYLVLGAKRSGNPYNKQDLQVLDIIANELVIAIQNALRFEEIEAFTVTLQEKVNEATRQLRQTNEKLKALDETKDEFISMASHQLRTPLTSVKGYVSMVLEGDAGKLNKQQKELLEQAFASSQRMVYLIADLLNVSRLKTGKFVIENKVTHLADVVAGEMDQLKATAESREQTLTYVKPDKFPDLMLDETKMRQVIMNFTDNALHYTPKGGHITVSLEDKGQTIEFKVVDDGLGVPKNEQHHLFSKFFRAGNARKARPDGTGLGLFMAKKVIIAQGGAVIFSSTEGKGSTFGFTMPKEALKVKTK